LISIVTNSRQPISPTPSPYTTLFRSHPLNAETASMHIKLANPRGFCAGVDRAIEIVNRALEVFGPPIYVRHEVVHNRFVVEDLRSEEHTSELQSRENLVCRLLLERKN